MSSPSELAADATGAVGRRASETWATKRVIDDFCFTYPGVKKVDHVYFYAVTGADDATRQAYLDRAYGLGREL